MRIPSLCLFAIIIFQLHFVPSFAQWTRESNGLDGGTVTAFLRKGDFLFAATERGGIFRSTDNGESWAHASNGLRPKFISSLALKDETIFATAFQGGGVFVSADNGESWQEKSTGLPPLQITSMLIMGDSLLIGTYDGVFVSTNNGEVWLPLVKGLPVTPPNQSIEINTLFRIGDGIIAGAFNKGAYRLDGDTWIPVPDIPSDAFVLSGAAKNDFAFMGTYDKLYHSVDGGVSWAAIEAGLPSDQFRSISFRGDSILTITINGLFVSEDQGSSWNEILPLVSGYEESLTAILVADDEIFLGRQGSAITYSSDGGQTWQVRNDGISALQVTSVTIIPDAVVASTIYGSFRSSDKAASWQPTNPDAHSVTFSTPAGDSILAIREHNGPLYVSSDKGLSWTPFSPPLPGGTTYTVLYHEGDIYASGTEGLMTLRRNTSNWTYLPVADEHEPITMVAALGDTVFCAAFQEFFVSYNRGAQWMKVTEGLPQTIIQTILVANNKLYVSTNGGFYITNAAANEWQELDFGVSVPTVLGSSGGFIFAGMHRGMSFSPDFGKTWIAGTLDYASTLTVSAVNADDEKVYLGTWEGLWTRPVSEFFHRINIFEPTSGSPGTKVTITGDNFSADASAFSLLVNGTPAEIISATPTAIEFAVPSGATSGPLVVNIDGRIAESDETFCVAPGEPTITSEDSDEGVVFVSSSTSNNQWFFNGAAIPDATDPTLLPTASGLYQVMVVGEDCSSELSAGMEYLITSLSASTEKPKLNAFPVPTTDKLMIEPKGFPSNALVHISVYDFTGRVIREEQTNSSDHLSISMKHLPSGVYLVKGQQGPLTVSARIVRE